MLAVILGAIKVLVFWYLLALNRWVLFLAGTITFLLASTFTYYMMAYGIVLSVGLIRVVMLAGLREVTEFLKPVAIFWIFLSQLSFTFFLFWRFYLNKRLYLPVVVSNLAESGWDNFATRSKKPRPRAVILTLVALAFMAIACKAIEPKVIKQHVSMPYVFYEHIYHYFLEERRINILFHSKTDTSSNYTFYFDNNSSPVSVVVIIEKSLRSDHLGINGYHRPTTPNMKESGVYSFRNSFACSGLTPNSVACMMTRGTVDNWELSLKEKSFISVFRKLGFSTYWLSNQGRIGHNTWVGSIAVEAERVSFCNDHQIIGTIMKDQCLLPMVQEALDDSNPHKLIIVHTYGNNIRYDDRYGSEFEKFTPVCDIDKPFSECDGERLVNTYDNSVLAIDSFYGSLTALMKEHNVFLFYLSDYGEPLGENGIRTRGVHNNMLLTERNTPFVIWMSDGMKKAYPKLEGIVKRNLNKTVSHDYLIYSVLSCSGVNSEFIDDKLNICSSKMNSYVDPYLERQ